MRIDRQTNRIAGATFLPSPNHDDRPAGSCVDLIVLHNISLPPQQFSGDNVERLFTNRLDCSEHPYYQQLQGLEVSSHLYIRRSGALIQFVPFHKRAWHAGKSSYLGRERCNDFSIGIELEGADEIPFCQAQYEVLIQVVRCMLLTYTNLNTDRIVGHSDIAPGRKTDPGERFNWQYLRDQLS